MTTSIMIPRVKPAWRDKDNTGCSVFSSSPSATIPVRGCSNCNGYKKPATLDIPGFAPSKSKTWEELSAAPVWCPKVCWGWTCPSSCSIWRSYYRRASRETIRTGRWIQNRGGHDQEGAAQHSHGDDAGVFGGVTTAGDFKSRSKRTVNVDFLWRGDDVVGRTLNRAARKESMMTSITDGMNTFRRLCLFISELL